MMWEKRLVKKPRILVMDERVRSPLPYSKVSRGQIMTGFFTGIYSCFTAILPIIKLEV